MAQLTGQRGRHFDPQVVNAFLAVAESFQAIAQELADAADDVQIRLRAVEAMGDPTA